jgi:hypothetical protein
MTAQSREQAKVAAVAQMFAATRSIPLPYAKADVKDILRAAAEWDAVQDAPTVRDLAELLSEHVVKPDGQCSCGVQVNDGKEKGVARARTLNRHRAMVVFGAGYRWAPEVEWEWAAVGASEAARDVETYSWGAEEHARRLYARLVAHSKARSLKGPVVLVRRAIAGDLEEVDRWTAEAEVS